LNKEQKQLNKRQKVQPIFLLPIPFPAENSYLFYLFVIL